MRQGTSALSMVSKAESYIPRSCEMKDEPEFTSLQGNLALIRVRSSRCPFHLRKQTHGRSHIPIAERHLLLWCLWNFGIPLELKRRIQLSSQDDLGYTELSSRCCAELVLLLDFGLCTQGICGVAERKTSHLSCLMGNEGWLWSQCSGIRPPLGFFWGTLSYFCCCGDLMVSLD